MSYRFVKVAILPPDFVGAAYANRPGLETLPYAEQLEHLLTLGFGWSDYYARNLRNLGVEAEEMIYGAPPLQHAWARESNVPPSDSPQSVLLDQLARTRPEVVFIQDAAHFSGSWVKELRRRVPSVRKVIGWCCAPHTAEQRNGFQAFDLMVTCTPGFRDDFSRQGMKTHLLPHAFEPGQLSRLSSAAGPAPESDFFFSGSLFGGGGSHSLRLSVLEALCEHGVNMAVHAPLPQEALLKDRAKQAAYLGYHALKKARLGGLARNLPLIRKAADWPKFPAPQRLPHTLRSCISPPLYGLEMLRRLAKAKIGFNVHIDVAGDYAGNLRLFEVTGVGSCLLTDAKKNLADYFVPGDEIVTYSSAEECIEKVNWLLTNTGERQAIAKRGQARCLRDHTFARRSELLHSIISSELRL